MNFNIRLVGSEKLIQTYPSETILEALIRAGVAIDYGCASGNCGLCLLSVLDGEVEKVQASDFVMSTQQKQHRCITACSHRALGDLVVALEASAPKRSQQAQRMAMRVRALKDLGGGVQELTLKPPRNQRLQFSAGQYARLAEGDFDENPSVCQGVFSIASCPCDARRLEFHLSERMNTPMAAYLRTQLETGQSIYVEAPYGNLVIDEEDAQAPVVLVAVEHGFAPIKSLFEHISGQEEERPVELYWFATKGQHYLSNLCRAWEDALDELSVHLVDWPESATDSPERLRQHGLEAVQQVLAEQAPRHSNARVYACIPGFDADERARLQACLPPAWHLVLEPWRSGESHAIQPRTMIQ